MNLSNNILPVVSLIDTRDFSIVFTSLDKMMPPSNSQRGIDCRLMGATRAFDATKYTTAAYGSHEASNHATDGQQGRLCLNYVVFIYIYFIKTT